MTAWQDWQGGAYPLIYGTAHTNAGALEPGYFVNGILLSVPTPGLAPATYEARMPDVIANPIALPCSRQ
jgi:hypothetical protein